MPPAAARAVTRGRFRVTQEDGAGSAATRDAPNYQPVLRGLQHQNQAEPDLHHGSMLIYLNTCF